jgi:hypothetical protein
MPEKDELIQGLLTVIRWRCCVCNKPATREPALLDQTRRTTVFIGSTYPGEINPGGPVVEVLFQATRPSKAILKFERWWKRYLSDYRLSFSLQHYAGTRWEGPKFCDTHGFEGLYTYMSRDFELVDLEYAQLIRSVLATKEPVYNGHRPTRYEREWPL